MVSRLWLQGCQLLPCWLQLGSCPRCATVVVSSPRKSTGSFIQTAKGMRTHPLTASQSCTGRVAKSMLQPGRGSGERNALCCTGVSTHYKMFDAVQVRFAVSLLVTSQPQHGRNAEGRAELVLIN